MNTVLRAFLLFVLLTTLALLLGQAGTGPLEISFTLGNVATQIPAPLPIVLKTTVPIAMTLLVMLLLFVFYLGRLTGWMMRLPKKWLNRRKVAAADAIADAYASLALHDLPATTKHITDVTTENLALADLLTLLRLHTATLSPTQGRAALENPRLAAVTALYLARHAAAQADWPEVKRYTTIGRKHAPQNLPLLTLQFKSLVNTNDPKAAELLPAFKSHLDPEHHRLLTQVLQGPNAITVRPVLDSTWVRSVQAWLPTPSDTFPTE